MTASRAGVWGLVAGMAFASSGFAAVVYRSIPLVVAEKASVKIPKEKRTKPVVVAKRSGRANRSPASTGDPGALVDIRMVSRVGVLLDEIPASIKTRVKQEYLAKPESFWIARAKMQIETTLYRLVYRNFFYSNKGQLPLPPKALWKIQVGSPSVTLVEDHELVTVDYQFDTTLLAPADSPALAEPKLASTGGVWEEPFVLPADPELLLERTGYACMDEEDFPPNSVDTENARTFYDQTCSGGSSACHVTSPYPKLSCSRALKENVGRIATTVRFERKAWNPAVADSVRIGAASPSGADLEVLAEGVGNNRIIYRYIAPGSCAIAEGCVGGSGWRRLLQFDASVANRGSAPAHLGDISDVSPLVQHNMFEFSACHGHRHFSHYGKFTFGSGTQQLGSKRAFCLESTSRYSNNEDTPLTHPYSCHYQGIEAGWGDDYIAGIECQWIDVTPVAGPTTAPLGFQSNPDQFICEGRPILDAQGKYTFAPTSFLTEGGQSVDRIACDFSSNWNANNFQSRDVSVPREGSFVTEPCTRGQTGPNRNCGFVRQGVLPSCTPGTIVRLGCKTSAGAAPQAIRICDSSQVLGVGTACTMRDSLANRTVEGTSVSVAFSCPAAKDSSEPGGKYSVYVAPVHVGDASTAVLCTQN